MLDVRIQRRRVFVIGVIPNFIEHILDVRGDSPIVLSVSDQYVCLIDACDILEHDTRIRPVTAAVFLPGPGQVAVDFAVAGREACIQNGKCRPFGCPGNRVALAGVLTS